MKQCRAYSGADIDSDYNLIVLVAKLKLKTLKKNKIQNRLNLDKLKQEDIRTKFAIECNNAINNHWQDGVKRKNQWITEEIITLMEQRRKFKNSNITKQKVKRWKEYVEELYNGNLNESVLEKEEIVKKDDKGE
ncbi:Hypothetical protein CINCED_3A024560 [Cinara cedri]|uniref:Uncharacterized protein n=1 Tax=Cinara cedri TaxID=506608 RepID=A0A5E4M7B9_9HEMI|nr:Hypothetical protein CINCED_3A024560 [Cinara cedri]